MVCWVGEFHMVGYRKSHNVINKLPPFYINDTLNGKISKKKNHMLVTAVNVRVVTCWWCDKGLDKNVSFKNFVGKVKVWLKPFKIYVFRLRRYHIYELPPFVSKNLLFLDLDQEI